jgi:hypothetical protein
MVEVSTLPAGLRLDGDTIAGIPTVPGTYTVNVTLRNPGQTKQEELQMYIKATPPLLKVEKRLSWPAGVFTEVEVPTANANNATLVATGLPAGLSVDGPSRTLRGVTTAIGVYPVRLRVGNGIGTDEANIELQVEPSVPITAKATVSVTNASATSTGYRLAGVPATLVAYFSGMPRDIVGLTIESETALEAVLYLSAQGRIWRPVSGLRVSEGKNYYSTPDAGTAQYWKLEINSGKGEVAVGWHEQVLAMPKPRIEAASVRYSRASPLAISYTIVATGSPTRFRVEGLPDGVVVDVRSGRVTGKPSNPGTYYCTVSATNTQGTGYGSLVITVD